MSKVTRRGCKQEGCNVSIDGKCLEGLDVDNCPHHFYYNPTEELVGAEIDNTNNKSEVIRLFQGEALSINETPIITYKHECELIFIIGEPGCGKTTLLASIYDLFQKGPINDIFFAGSVTQIGFEQRCHLSRVGSKAAIPVTEKTKSREFDFLHLALRKTPFSNNEIVHILLSDISGERLQLARDSSNALNELDALRSSHNVIYVIDGEKIANRREKYAALFNAKSFIRRALDEEIFTMETNLKVVVSKWDILVYNNDFNFDLEIKEEFSSQFEKKLSALTFQKMAARPEETKNDVHFGFGVYELLDDWINKAVNKPLIEIVFESSGSERSFDNYRPSL